jgi:hypothetical protein
MKIGYMGRRTAARRFQKALEKQEREEEIMDIQCQLGNVSTVMCDWHKIADERSAEINRLNSDLAAREREIAGMKEIIERHELTVDYQIQLLKSHIETLNAEKTELRLQAERDANRADKNAVDYSELKLLNAKALAMLGQREWTDTTLSICTSCMGRKPPSVAVLLRRQPGYDYGEINEGHMSNCEYAALIKEMEGR